MEYVYAAMLLHKAGKEISEIEEAIKSAPTMMAAQATAPATAETEEKPKKEEKKPEDEKDKEDAALEGLGALFG
jgi:large subunit ribosomal protein L12